MPRESLKRKYIRSLENLSAIKDAELKLLIEDMSTIESECDDPGLKDQVQFASHCLQTLKKYGEKERKVIKALKKKRYLFKEKNSLPKMISKKARLKYMARLDDDGFLEELRMDKITFYKLIDLVKDHPRYRSTPKNPQTDVRIQVAAVLERLGSNGNGSSLNRLARRFGVGSRLPQI